MLDGQFREKSAFYFIFQNKSYHFQIDNILSDFFVMKEIIDCLINKNMRQGNYIFFHFSFRVLEGKIFNIGTINNILSRFPISKNNYCLRKGKVYINASFVFMYSILFFRSVAYTACLWVCMNMRHLNTISGLKRVKMSK